VELDPPLLATALDDVPSDIGLPTFQQHNSGIDGSKVTVAVLDTGIDTDHPYLEVAESSNTSGEPIERPGVHGTHCAGIIASRDQDFRGVAPGVRLLNVKVGRANGYVEPGNLSRGFDTLSDTGFAIISVSLGFNHRPITSTEGHGWQCGRYRCVVCRAVDTSVRRGHLVVVAAGNEHERADALRRTGEGKSFDTELCCPGQTTAAVTVGSVSKRDGLPASTSSRGPSARGAAKPDIAAPGVNITSTIPIPRDADNAPERNAARRDLFARDSGTSMATPVVAGAAALLAQRMIERGREPTPAALKSALVRAATRLPFGHDAVGAGRVQMP
jgi:subtilisin family serine protease